MDCYSPMGDPTPGAAAAATVKGESFGCFSVSAPASPKLRWITAALLLIAICTLAALIGYWPLLRKKA